MAASAMQRLRARCLALPEAYEEETWGAATFRVRRRIFVMAADHDGGATVSMKVPRAEQPALLAAGEPFFYPRYVGPKGWIGVRLTSPALQWDELDELVKESYRLVAPATLGRQVA